MRMYGLLEMDHTNSRARMLAVSPSVPKLQVAASAHLGGGRVTWTDTVDRLAPYGPAGPETYLTGDTGDDELVMTIKLIEVLL